METLRKHSSQADLIMMGLPGNYTSESGKKYFRINEFFFSKEINKYSDLPPIIFVKSAYVLNLIEEWYTLGEYDNWNTIAMFPRIQCIK